MTIENLPDFVEHRADTRDFIINWTDDISLIGKYQVTVKAEIQFYSDQTKTETLTMNAKSSFRIYMHPCQVT